MQDQAAREEAAHSASYTYGFADFQALRETRRVLSPFDQTLWRWRYVWVPGFGLLVVFFLNWRAGYTADAFVTWDTMSNIGIGILSLIAFIALVDILFDRVLARWFFKRYSVADKPLSLTFQDRSIAWIGEGNKGELDWCKVTRVVPLNGHLFLFISKSEALCIPQRAFPSKDAFDSFVTYAKERANG